MSPTWQQIQNFIDSRIHQALLKFKYGAGGGPTIPSSGGSPSGPASGDLDGSYPSPTVVRIQGRPVSSTAPSNNDALIYSSIYGEWIPTAGGAGISGSGTSGQMAKWTGAGSIGDATNTDAEVASAVSLKHTQGTDTNLGSLSTKNPPIDADLVVYRDSTASNALVVSTWTQVKAFLRNYWDTLYAVLAHTHTGTGDSPKLAQANTHQSPDTDAATSSLHHTIGASATQAAAGNHTHSPISGGGGSHLHGLARWIAAGGTTFDLPDVAEYVENVFENGANVDATAYTLADYGCQIEFYSAPSASNLIQANYVVRDI